MTRAFKTILILLILVAVAIVGFIIYRQRLPKGFPPKEGSFTIINTGQPPILSSADNSSSAEGSQTTEFACPDGFYFYYPANWKVGQFEEGVGDVVLISSNEKNQQAQIYSSDFNEDAALTPERIKKDLPSMPISEVQTAKLDGEPAVAFVSDGVYNVWSVHQKKLIQTSVEVAQKDFLLQILSAWKWQEE